MIRISDQNDRLLIIGTNKQYQLCIYLFRINKGKVISSIVFPHSVNFKFKDAEFVQGRNDQFITVGIQCVTLWTLKNNILTFKELKIVNRLQKQRVEFGFDQTKDNMVKLQTYLSILFFSKNVFVTGTDNGHIQLWISHKVQDYYKIKQDSQIICMSHHSIPRKTFLIGDSLGNIYLYQLQLQKENYFIKL